MDKIDRLLDAIEHPESYTDTELETMLRDRELKEVLDTLDRIKSGLHPIATPDVDAEWKTFERGRRKTLSKSRFPMFGRKSAAGIAVAIASFVAVATVVGVGVNYFAGKNAETAISKPSETVNDTVCQPATPAVPEEICQPAAETIIFDNETLENILSQIAAFHGYLTEFKNDTSKSLRLYFRWNQTSPIEDIVESLNNFEQIHLTVSGKTIIIY